jgi:hypothetical protein
MQTTVRNGLPALTYPRLATESGLVHAVFTREGGVGPAPFDSLNVSFGVGDDPGSVAENRSPVSGAFGGLPLLITRNVHGNGVFVLSRTGAPGNLRAALLRPPTADAVVTDVPGVLLMVSVADCQPVFMYDPACGVAAGVHSGWRGSVKNILGKTVWVMRKVFLCDPAEILAGIGPSPGPCRAEFLHYQREIPRSLWHYKDPKHRLDFWEISVDQLTAAGASRNNIFVSGICTKCRTDLFFSYRGEGRTGRFPTAVALTDPEHRQHER